MVRSQPENNGVRDFSLAVMFNGGEVVRGLYESSTESRGGRTFRLPLYSTMGGKVFAVCRVVSTRESLGSEFSVCRCVQRKGMTFRLRLCSTMEKLFEGYANCQPKAVGDRISRLPLYSTMGERFLRFVVGAQPENN